MMKKIRISKTFISYTTVALVLVIVFLYIRFPEKVVANYLRAVAAERYPDASLSFASLSLGFPPGLILNNCQISPQSTQYVPIHVDRLAIRPRLLSYFAGKSSLVVNALGYGGSLEGLINFPGMSFSGKPSAVNITFTDLSLEKMSGLWGKMGRQITGKVQGIYSSTSDSQLDFTIKNGSYPLLEAVFGIQKVDFTIVEGKCILKGGVLRISKLTVSGDKINYSLKGDITLNSNLQNSEINLSGFMVISALNNKKVSMLLTGTLSNVQTRYL